MGNLKTKKQTKTRDNLCKLKNEITRQSVGEAKYFKISICLGLPPGSSRTIRERDYFSNLNLTN